MVPADSGRIPRVPPYSGTASARIRDFAYGPLTLCGAAFQPLPLSLRSAFAGGPTTPEPASPRARFGLLRFRSPLLAQSLLLSSPPGTEMFQFPGFASPPTRRGCRPTRPAGCPIRKSAHRRVCAPPRGLSQLVASFFASESQGILRAPLSPFLLSFPGDRCNGARSSPLSAGPGRPPAFFVARGARAPPGTLAGRGLVSRGSNCFHESLQSFDLLVIVALPRSPLRAPRLPVCQCAPFRV